MLFNQVLTWIINPNHVDVVGGFYPVEIADDVPSLMQVLVMI